MQDNKTQVTLFTKQNCVHCARAKSLLDSHGIAYDVVDTSNNNEAGQLSIYLSSQLTLPQVFIGGRLIGGADDLERLTEAGELEQAVENAKAANANGLPALAMNTDVLSEGVKIANMADYIAPIDATRSTDPEVLPLLQFYKAFFGYWPHCYGYLFRAPEATKTFIYTTVMSVSGGFVKEILGIDVQHALGFATSQAQGCGYCQVHTAAIGQKVENSHAIRKFYDGEIDYSDPTFAEVEWALIDLAGRASVNKVTDELLARIHKLAGDKAPLFITAAAKMASIFGFLNTFNDLTGVEIEAGWNNDVQSVFNIEMGTHTPAGDVSDNPDNLSHDIPQGDISIPEIFARYDSIAGDDYKAYMKEHLGLAPNWEDRWAEPIRARHAVMYVTLVGTDSPQISAELKHLMARVSAVVRGHDYLSAAEGFMAYQASEKTDISLKRVAECYNAAAGYSVEEGLFTDAEVAALATAFTSAQIPMNVIEKTATQLRNHYDQDGMIQLFVVCAVSASIQRWCAVMKPEFEPEVLSFFEEHNLPLSTQKIKINAT